MIELNLIPDNPSENKVKQYLEENVSEILAEKINNGVKITKDSKTLINKKSLKGFMEYAAKEAQKTVKNQRYACVDDETVYGWAIHYFEEDSIEEKLYNEDGTEYKTEKKKEIKTTTTTPTTKLQEKPIVKSEPKKKENTQFSIFDMLSEPENTVETKSEETENKPITTTPKETVTDNKEREISQQYLKYKEIQNNYKDCILLYKVGDFYEILEENAKTCAKELDLTLTGRDFGLEERVPMAGIPYYAADRYIAKLVEKGYKVAVADSEALIKEIENKKEEPKIDNETGEILTKEQSNEENFNMMAYDPEALVLLLEEFNNNLIVE